MVVRGIGRQEWRAVVLVTAVAASAAVWSGPDVSPRLRLIGQTAAAAAAALCLLLLIVRGLRRPPAADELLMSLVPPERILELYKIDLALEATQHSAGVRVLLLIHNRRGRPGHLRVNLAATRGRRRLASRIPSLLCELPSASLVMARLDVPLHPIRRPRRLRLGICGTPRFSGERNGNGRRMNGRRSPLLGRWRIAWMRFWHGPSAVVDVPLVALAADDLHDPLDHRPEWSFYTLRSPADPKPIEQMRELAASAMNARG